MRPILVAGANRVDAGKTTFTAGLVAETSAIGFKPRAGSDRWFHHDVYRETLAEGRLFGQDARTLADASPGSTTPEEINPVHRLWRPSPGQGTGLLGRDDREFLVDRVGSRYVENATTSLPEDLVEALDLADAIAVESLTDLNQVMADLHLPALRSMGERIAAADAAVVESYGDVARPIRDPDPALVAVVEPRRVRYYDGERYAKACEVAQGGPDTGQLEERVPAVVDLIDPLETMDLPALPSDVRNDPRAIGDAYGHLYERLSRHLPSPPA